MINKREEEIKIASYYQKEEFYKEKNYFELEMMLAKENLLIKSNALNVFEKSLDEAISVESISKLTDIESLRRINCILLNEFYPSNVGKIRKEGIYEFCKITGKEFEPVFMGLMDDLEQLTGKSLKRLEKRLCEIEIGSNFVTSCWKEEEKNRKVCDCLADFVLEINQLNPFFVGNTGTSLSFAVLAAKSRGYILNGKGIAESFENLHNILKNYFISDEQKKELLINELFSNFTYGKKEISKEELIKKIDEAQLTTSYPPEELTKYEFSETDGSKITKYSILAAVKNNGKIDLLIENSEKDVFFQESPLNINNRKKIIDLPTKGVDKSFLEEISNKAYHDNFKIINSPQIITNISDIKKGAPSSLLKMKKFIQEGETYYIEEAKLEKRRSIYEADSVSVIISDSKGIYYYQDSFGSFVPEDLKIKLDLRNPCKNFEEANKKMNKKEIEKDSMRFVVK